MYTTEALLRGRLSLRKIDYFLTPPLDYRLLFDPISILAGWLLLLHACSDSDLLFYINLTEIYSGMHGRPASSQPAGWPDCSGGKSQSYFACSFRPYPLDSARI